jgi:hypothetical protein
VQREAYVLAYIDAFWLIAWVSLSGLLLILLLRPPAAQPADAAAHLDRRLQEQERTHQGRDRVAGQPDHRRAAIAARHQRLAGPHRDLPEIDREPVFAQHAAHQIVLADRDAAGRDQQIDPARARREAAQSVGIVGRVAERRPAPRRKR